jgi:hypothetical protein
VTAARVLVFIQAALMLLAAIALGAAGASTGHGALGGVLAAVNGILAITLLAAGVRMGACEQWTRVTVLSIEGLIILNDVATIALGARVGLIGLAIAVAVTVLLLTAPARACFARR